MPARLLTTRSAVIADGSDPGDPPAGHTIRSRTVVGSGLLFLAAVVHSGEKRLLERVDDDLFTEDEMPLWTLVRQHSLTYHAVPSPEVVAQHGIVMPTQSRWENVEYYLDRLLQRSVHQILTALMPDLHSLLTNRRSHEALERVREAVAQSTRRQMPAQFMSMGEALEALRQKYLIMRLNPDAARGIPTGFQTLDDATMGLFGGDLVTLVGRTGQGKSWIWQTILYHAYLSMRKVFMFSLEMTEEQLALRLAGLITGINPRLIKTGALSHWAEADFFAAVDMVRANDRIRLMKGDGKRTTEDVQRVLEEWSPDVVGVDASYLLSPRTKRKMNAKWEKIAEVMADMKGLAGEFMCPFVSTVQFNRDVKANNPGTNIDAGSIGGSDEIGQLSSVIVGILQGPEPHQSTQRKLVGMKNREGDNFSFETTFQFQPVRIHEIRRETEESDSDDEDGTGVASGNVTSWMH